MPLEIHYKITNTISAKRQSELNRGCWYLLMRDGKDFLIRKPKDTSLTTVICLDENGEPSAFTGKIRKSDLIYEIELMGILTNDKE